jgi:uncharacterized protein (TIGR00297 family)
LAACAVGALTFGAGGLGGAYVLLAFFVTASVLSCVGRARKHRVGDIAKGGPRDALQVLANGGIATLSIVAFGRDPLGFAAFAGAYAAANADTWGTEIGMLVREPPHSILTGRPLATGLSGGVTAAGSVAEIAGALAVAAVVPFSASVAGAAGAGSIMAIRLVVAVTVGGVSGALVDSLLGATLQERRWCPACATECENDPHACGTPTTHHRGIPWLTNDGVNFAATATGALVAVAVTAFVR